MLSSNQEWAPSDLSSTHSDILQTPTLAGTVLAFHLTDRIPSNPAHWEVLSSLGAS